MAVPLTDAAPGDARDVPPPRGELVEHVAVVLALVVLVGPVAHAEGGRGPGAAAGLGLVSLLALAATRPWVRLTSRGWLLAPVVALAAFYVVPATGGGRAASVAALSYATAAALVLSIAAYARTPARRAAVAGLLAAGGVAQFAWALVPWWGGGDAANPMVGTYFWHNQLAVALLLPALLGLALAVSGRRPWRAAGWLAAPLCVAGLVLSTSRATTACLVVGWVAVVAGCVLTARNRRRVAARAVVLSLVAAGLTLLLPGPPLFDSRVSPLAGASARAAAGETLDSNTLYRTQFWREAVTVTLHHPVTGAGYGQLAKVAVPLTPTSWAHSPLAHSGPLQAFADGGLLLGLALLAGLAVACLALLRLVLAGVRRSLPSAVGRPASLAASADSALGLAAAGTALALVAHSLVDIDWTYPALTGQFAVVLGLALAYLPARATALAEPAPRDLVAATGSAVLALVVLVGSAAAWDQSFHISAPSAHSSKVHP
jgi:O-antigen ligase